jgi:hypothetical protein
LFPIGLSMEDKFFQLYSRFQNLEEQFMQFRSEMSAFELDLQSALMESVVCQNQPPSESAHQYTLHIANTANVEMIAG